MSQGDRFSFCSVGNVYLIVVLYILPKLSWQYSLHQWMLSQPAREYSQTQLQALKNIITALDAHF